MKFLWILFFVACVFAAAFGQTIQLCGRCPELPPNPPPQNGVTPPPVAPGNLDRAVCGIDLSRPYFPVREFGSRCLMDVNNCQNRENFREVDINVCRGYDGIRN